MTPRIGSHYSNDRASLYEFERNSRLPIGYFDRGIDPRIALMWGMVAAIILGLVIAVV